MNKIEKLLSVGDMRTTGKAEQVIKQVLAKPDLFADVIYAMLVEHPGIRMRAADVAEKISLQHPDWLQPYKKLLLGKIAKISQQEVRWHTAQMLPRLMLTSNERQKVYQLMLSYLDDKSSIVKAFAMQAMTDIALQDKTYQTKVRNLIKRLMQQGTPAMQSRGRKLLILLNSV